MIDKNQHYPSILVKKLFLIMLFSKILKRNKKKTLTDLSALDKFDK